MLKAQSVIEYVTTYGWAIIIIAVVLAALYGAGVFNPSNFASRAKPGACTVYRPYGPATIQLINLQGLCGSQLPSEVAYFNGMSSNVGIANSPTVGGTGNQITISAWIYANSSVHATQTVLTKSTSLLNTGFTFPGTSNGWTSVSFALDTGAWTTISASYPALNTWHNVVATYNGAVMDIYVDGSLKTTAAESGNILVNPNNLTIGNQPGGAGTWFSGKVANIQYYNSSLNSNSVSLLFTEGIGGAPVNLQNLVGWWPLNGDMVDYSGNGNNGASNTIFFATSWTSGYSH